MPGWVHDALVAIGFVVGVLAALEVGFRRGRRASTEQDSSAGAQIGAIQGALLGLLGLLLAFSFSAAGARFMERQDLIIQEANAIGTAYLRADLLDRSSRAELRGLLTDYTHHRLGIVTNNHRLPNAAELAQVDALQDKIWDATVRGVRARPESTVVVLNAINEVIDVHSLRMAAGLKHLPPIVLWLLIAASVLSIGVIGFGCGLAGRRRAQMTIPLALLVGAALWITFDLDQPRAGLLQLSDEPLAIQAAHMKPD